VKNSYQFYQLGLITKMQSTFIMSFCCCCYFSHLKTNYQGHQSGVTTSKHFIILVNLLNALNNKDFSINFFI